MKRIHAVSIKSLSLVLRLCLASILVLSFVASNVFGQTEPESSTSYLQVRTQGQHYKNLVTLGVGEKLSVRQGKGSKMVHGKITAIQDSAVVIDETTVPLASVTELKTRLEGETIFAGCIMFLIAAGLGLLGWVFGKAMFSGGLTKWWEWTLVVLGALFVVLFGPVALIGSFIVWALSRKHYKIGERLKLEVFQKSNQPAPIDPDFGK